jgi:hypothetical protein
MRDAGVLRADVEQLTHAIMAALQGGMLFTHAQSDLAPLRVALPSAVEAVRTAAA